MAEITTTQAFSDGDTVTATKLNNITGNASIQTEAITNRSAETTVDQANDLLLMYDASATALKKVTLSNVIKAGTASNFPVTGNATIGGTLGVTGASTLSGNTSVGGTLAVIGAITASSTINGTTIPSTKTLVTTDDAQTLTNKTIALGSNSVSGTLAQFNSAVSDADLVSIAGAETLTNKTLTNPVISTISNTGTLTLPTSTDTLIGRATTDTLTNKTLTSPVISGGTINNSAIGGTTAAAGAFTTLSATGVLTTQAGTASAPAVSPTGDSNTGLFFPAADTLAATTQGTERLRVDSSGNVGIGTTSFSKKFNVSSNNSTAYSSSDFDSARNLLLENKDTTNNSNIGLQFLVGTNAEAGITAIKTGDGEAALAIGTRSGGARTERLRIDSSGNVGIGTTSPATKLTVSGTNGTGSELRVVSTGANTAGRVTLYESTSGCWEFATSGGANSALTIKDLFNNAERLRVDSSGNLLVGKDTTAIDIVGYRFDKTGENYTSVNASTNSIVTNAVRSTSAAQYRFYVGLAGTVYATNTTISAISDIRYKENIRDLDIGLNSIMALRPRVFDWKDGKGKNIKNDRGFIAQEFEQVFPDLVDEWKDEAPQGEEPYKSVRQDLIPVLVKAIQELKTENDSLKSRVAALEAA